jgi:hypothetical protein
VIVLFVLSIIANKLKLEPSWNTGKEASFIFLFLLCVGIVQFLIRDIIYNNPNNWSWHYLFEEIKNTFLVGGLFVVILIPWNFNRLNVKNIRLANNLNSVIEENSVISKKTSTNTGKVIVDNRELTLDELIFVKSEGNYLEIYQYGKKPSPILIRFTLKDLEALLNAYPNMIKTHRSYLVNSKYIERITGNAQGYQLHFSHYVVPVSRNMIAKFNSRIKLA